MSMTATPWPNNEDELANHFNHLSMDNYSELQQQLQPQSQHRHNQTQLPGYPTVAAQRPPFGPFDASSPYVYFTPGGEAYSTAAGAPNGTPSFTFSELGSPMTSLQSLPSFQSLQSLSHLQSLMAANATGLAFDPYPTSPEGYTRTHTQDSQLTRSPNHRLSSSGNMANLTSAAASMNMANMAGLPHMPNFTPQGTPPSGAPAREQGAGHYRQQLQQLRAQSTGLGYYYAYEDRRQVWTTQTPSEGQRGELRKARGNSSSRGMRRGSRGSGKYNASAIDLSHSITLPLVYPPTPSPSQYNLAAAANPFGANLYSPVAYGTMRRYDTPIRSNRLDEFRRHRNNNRMELAAIAGHVCEFACDQHGSRFIQNKLETASAEERAKVFDEIMPNAYHLMTDVFGNYVIQKMFENGDPEQKEALVNTMENHVLHLSMQMYGCRVVQKALEHVLQEQREKLVMELAPHVIDCVKSANANHVIQRLMALDPPASILNEFQGHVRELSSHPYGCRVLQKSFEILKPSKIRALLNELHTCTAQLVTDQFGNYVVQSILSDDPEREQDRDKVVECIKPRIYELSRHKFASNVVEKAIKFAKPTDRRKLISNLIGEETDNPEERVAILLRDGFGNFPVQTALAEADLDQRDKLLSIIIPLMPNIRHTPCGRRLESKLTDYEYKGVVPSLSHSLTASSVNSPDLDLYESEGIRADLITPPPRATEKNNSNGAANPLRRVATSPDSKEQC